MLPVLAERLIGEPVGEAVDVLREMLAQNIVTIDRLPAVVRLVIHAEQLADRLAEDPDAVLLGLAMIDEDDRYASELQVLEQALRVLAQRERIATLWRVVVLVQQSAGDAVPGERGRDAQAARAARSIADRRILEPVVDVLLSGSHEAREAARALLLRAGGPAAEVLYEKRRAAAADRGLRARFVGTVREMGRAAVPMVRDALSRIVEPVPESECSLLEDMLRAAPDSLDEELLEQAMRFVGHSLGSIRRAALAVVVSAGGERARDTLVSALADDDEAVRVAALHGIRRLGSISRTIVEPVAAMLADERASDELRSTAAAVLGEADDAAGAAAHAALCRTLEPAKASMAKRLWGSSRSAESPELLANIARSLQRLDRPGARAAVERRLRTLKGEAHARLSAILQQIRH